MRSLTYLLFFGIGTVLPLSSVQAYRQPYFTNPSHRSEFMVALQPKETLCFTEDFEETANYTFEFKARNHAKVDLNITNPRAQRVYDKKDTSTDRFTFLTWEGTFSFCFINKEMGVVAKTVYIRLERTEPLPPRYKDENGHFIDAVGPLQFACDGIYKNVYRIRQFQSSHRLWAEDGREFADKLNGTISYLGCIICCMIVGLAFAQLYIVRTMFECTSKC